MLAAKRVATFLCVLILFALAPHGVALAQVTGHTTAGSLTFTLTDLDLTDGINPSLVFDELPYVPYPPLEYSVATLTARNLNSTGSVDQMVTKYGTGTEDLSQAYQSGNDTWVTASLSGRGLAETHLIEIETYSSTDGLAFRLSGASINTGRLEFTLSPNTAVAFRVSVTTEASVTQGLKTEEFYHSVAWLDLILGEDPFTSESYDQIIHTVRPESGATEASLDVSETLHAAIDNTSDTYTAGYVVFGAGGDAGSSINSAIPEPAALPMLATGLFVIVVWRRGRSRRIA